MKKDISEKDMSGFLTFLKFITFLVIKDLIDKIFISLDLFGFFIIIRLLFRGLKVI